VERTPEGSVERTPEGSVEGSYPKKGGGGLENPSRRRGEEETLISRKLRVLLHVRIAGLSQCENFEPGVFQ
jgi:hypothetical protein